MSRSAIQAFVAGIGLRGPGLEGWQVACPILARTAPWRDAALALPPASLLAANERRRAGLPVRLALAVAEEAVRASGLALDAVRGVFGSANGEGAILHALLDNLASEAPQLSPTQFHNSVHNAVAGYWAMGAQSNQPMTCLGAHAQTFAATLLKATAELAASNEPVLLCAYDVPMPEPLAAKQPTGFAFGCALVLVPQIRPGILARLRVSWQADRPAEAFDDTALGTLARQNPAARSLPLLRAIAAGETARLAFGLLDGALLCEVDPCSTATRSPG